MNRILKRNLGTNSHAAAFILAVAMSFAVACAKSNYLTVGETATVQVEDGMYLRTSPSVSANKILVVPKGKQVYVIAAGKPEKLFEIKSKWYRVSYGQHEGWMWGGLAKSADGGSATRKPVQDDHDNSTASNTKVKVSKQGLVDAVEKCDIDYVEKAADSGLSMNFWYRDQRAFNAITPLMRASAGGTYYISNGSMVSDCRSADLVKALIRGGAQVNAQIPGESTALMYASERGDVAVVKALLDSGANVHAKSQAPHHETAYQRADRHPKVLELLAAHGASKLK